jgi:hypothetical protein
MIDPELEGYQVVIEYRDPTGHGVELINNVARHRAQELFEEWRRPRWRRTDPGVTVIDYCCDTTLFYRWKLITGFRIQPQLEAITS